MTVDEGKSLTNEKSEIAEKGDAMTVHPPVPWLLTCRVTLAIISSLGFLIMYATKVNLSVAIVCMVNHTAVELKEEGEIVLGNDMFRNSTGNLTLYDEVKLVFNQSSNKNVTFASDRKGSGLSACEAKALSHGLAEDGEFLWDKQVQSIILGSFFYGYIITQVPGGFLAGRFGGKRIFAWFMFLCVVATLLTPVAARLHYGFLIALRILAGIGQGVVWPAMHALWAFWAPPEERSKLIGFTFAGAQIGNVVAFPLSGVLCKYGFDGGWPSIFYILGILGIVWFVSWMLIVSDTPDQHPRISEYEKVYIQSSLKGAMKKGIHNTAIPWSKIATSLPVWATVITHTCANWITYTFLTNMPAYMKEVLKFDIKSNGFLSAVPYLGMWSFIVMSGVVSDALTKSKKLTVTQARKIFNTLGELVPAAAIIALGFLDCTLSYVAVILLTIAVSFTGCAYSAGYMVNPADIAPKYSSVIFGISNSVATIPGFLAPFTVGQLTPHKSQEEWRVVFYIAAAICIFGNIFYLIFGSGELQDWAKEEEETSDVKQKLKDDAEIEL